MISDVKTVSERSLLLTAALLGFSSVVTQVILLRELFYIFSGNELITGIVLGSWMLLTGIGAWIRHSNNAWLKIVKYIIWLGAIPIILLILLYSIKHYFFQPGILIDIRFVFPVTLLLLAPYCIPSGYLFAIVLSSYHFATSPSSKGKKANSDNSLSYKRSKNRADWFYAIETTGSIMGGLVVSFILIFWFSSIQSLLVILLIHIIVAYTLKQINRKTWKYLGATPIIIILFFLPSDLWLKKLVFPNQEILKTSETPYGNITITKNNNQINVFENHELYYTTKNLIETEETVHYPMLQHPAPQNVLMVCGGSSDLIKEILKYKTVRRLDYVEENRWLMHFLAGYDTLPADKRVNVANRDIRKFLTSSTYLYDVVIINAFDPKTLQTNRFYTLEFFQLLKSKLTDHAIVSLSLPPAGNYYSKENLPEHSLMMHTLKQVFPHVLIIPGEKDYIIASSKAISKKIGDLSNLRGVETAFVNQYYIDDYSLGERIKTLEKSIVHNSNINKDFKPLAVYYSISQYLSKFSGKTILFIILPMILLLLPAFGLKTGPLILYISGFSISALEVFLLLSFQIVFGYVYAASGVIISLCMAGLAVGSFIGWKWNYRPTKGLVLVTQIFLGITSSAFIWIISKSNITWHMSILYLTFVFATMLPSICCGLQFSNMIKKNEIIKQTESWRFYSAELFGAALGAILIANFILPYLGLDSLVLVIAGSNGFAVVLLALSKT